MYVPKRSKLLVGSTKDFIRGNCENFCSNVYGELMLFVESIVACISVIYLSLVFSYSVYVRDIYETALISLKFLIRLVDADSFSAALLKAFKGGGGCAYLTGGEGGFVLAPDGLSNHLEDCSALSSPYTSL